jgi:Family of unknown function (DUF6491)
MTKLLPAILTALAVAAAAGAAAAAQDAPHGHAKGDDTPCFFITQWQGWKAPNDHTLYLGVNYHDVYEVELSGSSSMLQDADARLISLTQGPPTVCAPLDLQLAVSEPPGITQPLIARSLVKLTPEQVKAIPPKYRPY